MSIPLRPGRELPSPGLRTWAVALQVLGGIPVLIVLAEVLRYETRQPHSGVLIGVEIFGYGFVLALIGIPFYALGYTLGLIHYFRPSAILSRFEYLLLAFPVITAVTYFAASVILRWRY